MAVDIFARTVALASLGNNSEDSYTKAEIDKMFGEVGTVQVEAVDVLPTENIRENVIYLVPNGSSGENYYDECMYINGKWEIIGNTKIDLSNYYTKDEVDNKSIVNIALPKSTFEGSSGNIRQEDYQAFLPLLQFLYTKCKGTSGDRFIRLPLVNINTAHDSSTWLDLDNGQLFLVNESYTKTNNTINVRLDGVPKLDESGVAKYFRLRVTGNIENDNITSIKSVSINKSTIPVATKQYVDDSKNYVGEYKFLILDDIYSLSKEYFDSVLLPAVKSVGWEKVVVILSHSIGYNAMGLYMFHQKIESTDEDGNAIQTIIFETIHPNIWEQYKSYYTSGSMLIEPTITQIVLTITNDEFANATFNYKRSGSGPRVNLLPIAEDAKNAPKVFIPTYDAEPATKKYVDDAVGSIVEPVTYIEDNSESNPFILEEHDPGMYVFNNEPYLKARTSNERVISWPTLDNTIYILKTPLADDPAGTIVASYTDVYLRPGRIKLSSIHMSGLEVKFCDTRKEFVSIGGRETISGEKTFRYLPKLEKEKTPTADLEFVTKKYVDNSIANINVSFDDVYVVTCGHRFDGGSYNITDDGSIAEMMNTYWPKYLANSNQGGLVIWKDYTDYTNGTTLIGYMRGREIYIQWPWNSQNNGLVSNPYGSVGVVTITGSWDSSTETYTLTSAVWNRTNYVPTKDWNPANKKYVDKSITTAIAKVSQFSLLPVDVLPTEDIKTNVIYAVPSDNPKEKDVRIEYVYINDSWEILGNTKIDLSNTIIDGGTF